MDINVGFKRICRHFELEIGLKLSSKKRKFLVKTYAEYYNIIIDKSHKNWVKHFIEKELYREDSKIFIKRKLPSQKLSSGAYKRKYLKKKKDYVPPKTNNRRKIYLDYISSEKWRSFANKIKAKRGMKCEKCSASGCTLHAHHLTYIRFMNELESDIQVLCVPCHKKIHGR